mgnify:CR=1 FL=1
MDKSTYKAKVGLAEMLKGGVIMDVMNVEQARIAEQVSHHSARSHCRSSGGHEREGEGGAAPGELSRPAIDGEEQRSGEQRSRARKQRKKIRR